MIAHPFRQSTVLQIFALFAGTALFIVGIRVDATATWRLFLSNLLFWSGVTTGSVAFAALLEVAHARWPGPIREVAEDAIGAVPMASVLCFVLIPGMRHAFQPAGSAGAAGLQRFGAVALRDAFAFAALYAAGLHFVKRSRTARKGAGAPSAVGAAAVFLLVYVAVWSLVAIDLVMRLDPGWSSTLFPAYVFFTNMYAGIAAVNLAAVVRRRPPPREPALDGRRAADLAKLLLACSLIWLYLFWSQYFVIWYGNIPDEFRFVVDRTSGGWHVAATIVLACCVVGPAGLLIMRRTLATVTIASGLCLAGVWLERLLLVFPPLSWQLAHVAVAAALAIGCAAAFALPRTALGNRGPALVA
jgi:hypothetical protein